MAAPAGNKNAEKWSLEHAEVLFQKCLNVARDKDREDNDFIGEIALACDTYLTQLHDLKDKYPTLEIIFKQIKSCCEANCFRNGKKNKIIPSMAIMNLKSNHGWTDRSENINKHEIEDKRLSDEEREKKIEEYIKKRDEK